MSYQSDRRRRKLRKLNCGLSHGSVNSKQGRKGLRKQQLIKQAVQSISSQPQCTAQNKEATATSSSGFEILPVECKIRVFSFLSDQEKCRAATVCCEWARIMRTPCLWQDANFSGALSQGELPADQVEAYRRIKERAKNYVYHLVSREALLRRLTFELDIIEGEEIWLKFLIYCLKMTKSHELKVLHAKWANSADFVPFRAERHSWKSDRVKSFQSLLLTLLDTSPSLEEIHAPFDWSLVSVHLLCSFKQLHTLELDRYWVFAVFREERLSQLLEGLPALKRFKLSVCIPLFGNLSFPQYIVASDSLEVLDISNSTCFFLRSVRLPSLISFSTARNSWTGPMLSRDAVRVPCVYDILKTGAPNLTYYNQCCVGEDWRSKVSSEFEESLKSSCYCSRHKRGHFLY